MASSALEVFAGKCGIPPLNAKDCQRP